MKAFAFAHGPDWRACVDALGRPGRGLGFVYFTDVLAGEAHKILDVLKTQTGVRDWIGSVGTGAIWEFRPKSSTSSSGVTLTRQKFVYTVERAAASVGNCIC